MADQPGRQNTMLTEAQLKKIQDAVSKVREEKSLPCRHSTILLL